MLAALSLLATTRAETISEKEIVREALSANPMLKASVAKWNAMKERVPQAKAWDDPMAGVDFERMGTTKLGKYSDAEWMLSQTVPIAGKNLSRARAAESEARAAFEDVRRTRLDLIAKTRTAFHRLANAHQQLALNEHNSAIAGEFASISRKKYEVGSRTQADVFAAETDIARLAQERFAMEREVREQEAALNVLLNRPASSQLGAPAPLSFRELSWTEEKLRPLALAQRPEVLSAEQRIGAESAKVQLAKREWIPEPQLRVEARHFRGSSETFSEYDTGVFFSIPWGNARKYSAGVREAERGLEAARLEREAARTETLGMLREKFSKLSALARQYQLSRDKIVPLAKQTVETLQAGYQADTATFLDLLIAQRTQREAEATALNQLTDYLVALAELDAIAGIEPAERTTSTRTNK